MRVHAASELDLSLLRQLFNEGFSDYLLPLQLDATMFRAHLECNDVDLDCSQVAVEERPVALALIARRGAAGWVGGMGTAPDHRRRGLGEKALAAGLEAVAERGCREVWLEVVTVNSAAIAMYDKLGFEVVRDVIVWTLAATGDGSPESRPVDPQQAQAWIGAHRPSREPWQRSDESLDRIRARGTRLGALMVERDGKVTGAAVFGENANPVTVFQIAAVDDDSAADALLAAAGGERALRLSNAPVEEPPSRALEGLGASAVTRQHEMRIAL